MKKAAVLKLLFWANWVPSVRFHSEVEVFYTRDYKEMSSILADL
jgi:hypothetical protein